MGSILSRFCVLSLLISSCSCSPVQAVPTPDEPAEQKIAEQIAQPAVIPDIIPASNDKYFVPVIAISGTIDEDGAKLFNALLEKIQAAKATSVIIEINSVGGDVDSAILMVKAMEASTMRLVCVVDAEAASMAYYVLQGCNVRLMTKRSVLMIHQPKIALETLPASSQDKFHNFGNFLDATNKGMVEHEAKKMKIKPSELLKRIPGEVEWWLNWQEALKVGAVDGIVESTHQVAASMRSTNKVPYKK